MQLEFRTCVSGFVVTGILNVFSTRNLREKKNNETLVNWFIDADLEKNSNTKKRWAIAFNRTWFCTSHVGPLRERERKGRKNQQQHTREKVQPFCRQIQCKWLLPCNLMSFLLIFFSVAVVKRPLYIFLTFLSFLTDLMMMMSMMMLLLLWVCYIRGIACLYEFFFILLSSSLHLLALLAHLALSVFFFIAPFIFNVTFND